MQASAESEFRCKYVYKIEDWRPTLPVNIGHGTLTVRDDGWEVLLKTSTGIFTSIKQRLGGDYDVVQGLCQPTSLNDPGNYIFSNKPAFVIWLGSSLGSIDRDLLQEAGVPTDTIAPFLARLFSHLASEPGARRRPWAILMFGDAKRRDSALQMFNDRYQKWRMKAL